MKQFIFTVMIFFIFSGLRIHGQSIIEDTLNINNKDEKILIEFLDDIFDTNNSLISASCSEIDQLSLEICVKLKTPYEAPCPFIYDPVCGCDDITYTNTCFAGRAGIIDWYPGVCGNGGGNVDPIGTGLAKAKRKKKVRSRPLGEICDGNFLDITWIISNEIEPEPATDSVEITKTFCINQLCGNNVCLPGVLSLGFNTLSSNTTYRAEGILSNSTIPTNKNITFKADEDITLLPGFHAKSGSNFTATIEPCSSSSLINPKEPMSQINQEKRIPINELTLEVYPNPIKNQSTIKFGLPKDAPIELSIYTLQGQQVQQILQNSVYNKGQHQIEWNPSNLPEGMYLISLKTGDQEIVQKVIIQ